MREPATLFQPGQGVYHLSLGASRRATHRISFGVIVRIAGERATIRPLGGGRARVVRLALLTHAGYCPACEEPAHAQGYAPVCPHCRRPAEPTPPPDTFVLAHFDHPRQLWPRVVRRLVLAEQFTLTDAELGQAMRAAQAEGAPLPRLAAAD